MVDLLIILFDLKLDAFYWIGAIAWISWRWFVMIYFFVHIKMSYYWFSKEELLKKVSDKYHNKGNKGSNRKLLSIIEIM